MVNGKQIEVRYNSDELLPKVAQLARHFQGLAGELVTDEKEPYIAFVEVIGKNRHERSVFSGRVSYTSLYWKMKDLVYGKDDLKVSLASKNRKEEQALLKEVQERGKEV